MARPPSTADKKEPKRRAEHHAELLMGLANQRGSTYALSDDVDAFTIEEFCRRNRISTQLFYKRPDLMPATFYVASRRLVARETAARWRAAREAANAANVNTPT